MNDRVLFTLLLLLFCSAFLFGEGTKELKPSASSNVEGALNPWDWGGDFASYTSAPNTRMNIRIDDFNNERIYFGFNSQYGGDTYVRIKDPSGNIVYGPTEIVMSNGSPGYIENYSQAVAGPDAVDASNGYTSLSYQPNTNGDYFIELNTDDPNNFVQRQVRYNYFDVSVVNTTTSSQIPGRLWAKKWALSTYSTNNIFQPTLYIMRDDGVIYEVIYNDIRPFGFGVIANSWGINQSETLEVSRKSEGTSYSYGTVPYEPEHSIFLNAPDPNAFAYATEVPEVELTSVTNISCDENGYCIEIFTTEDGQVELEIDVDQNGFVYGSDDVYILETVVPGTQCVYWNGLDNSGTPVSNGAPITMNYTYESGIIHFPIYDAENNTGGFSVNLIAPTNAVNKAQFWDDSDIGGAVELDGCTSNPCHTWTGSNEEFHNTWARSFAYSSDTTFAFEANCPPDSQDATVETETNIDYFFQTSDFYFGDFNAGDVLDHVIIGSLPVDGALYLDANSNGTYNTGEEVSVSDNIDAAEITDLAFSPQTDEAGSPYASFLFKISDGLLESEDDYTMTINVDCGDITGSGSINEPGSPPYCDTETVSFNVSGYSNANGYTWQVPAGASIVSGQGTSSIVVDFNDAGFSGGYQLCVTPNNECDTVSQLCTAIQLVDCDDTDNDGVMNDNDLDSDNDGITDCAEK
ncbi:MAG TPA: hypothetical protein VJ951_14325, partial [Bacteroidales bacterium]|nr:hypothetical protein [Bacteroidales bacterium]